MKEINKIKIEKEITKIKNKYNYTWDKEGKIILLNENKLIISEVEKKILEVLLIKEIPNELHKNLWLISSGSRLLLKENKGYYSKLIKFYTKMEEKDHYFYKYETRKISRDLYRSNLKEEEVYKLKNILYAFIVRNLTISYCQGLNLIVSYLLQMTEYNEEETFYLFLKLMEDILPFDYFLFGIGIEAELIMIKKLLEKFDNELYNHLTELKSFCYLDSKLSMWIISLMNYKIDIKITNFFFDCIFLYATNNDNFLPLLYKMIFSILTILRNDLLNCVDSTEINNVINKFVNNKISDENYQKIIYYNLISQEKNKFKDKSIFELRKKIIQNIMKERKLNFKFEENIQEIICENFFPLCIKEKEEKPIEEFIVYKSNNDLSSYLIDEYYKKDEMEENNKNDDIKQNNKKEEINNKNDIIKEEISIKENSQKEEINDKKIENEDNDEYKENNKKEEKEENNKKENIEERNKKEEIIINENNKKEEIEKKEETEEAYKKEEIEDNNKKKEINIRNKKEEINENNKKKKIVEKNKKEEFEKHNMKEEMEEINNKEEINESNKNEEINETKEINETNQNEKINKNEDINENNGKVIINNVNKNNNKDNEDNHDPKIISIEEDDNIFIINLIIERRKHFC